jgi:hypothetical protein
MNHPTEDRIKQLEKEVAELREELEKIKAILKVSSPYYYQFWK